MGWERRVAAALCLGLGLLLGGGAAQAQRIKVAVGQRGAWDTAISELGQQAGIFRKHGLELELLYTQGGAETQQAVLSRSVEIGVAVGTLGVLGAAARGAPLRIIAGEVTGAAELYWYVPAASPIRSVADLTGRTVAFSTTGSSSHAVLLLRQAQDKLDLKPVATGGSPATYTQVMSGQIDVGWATAPFGIDQLAGKIRMVFRGSDVPAVRDETVRVTITHAAELAERRDMIARYLRGYRETLDWMYASPEAIPAYARFAGVSEEVARRTRDEFFPKAALDPDRISGLDRIMADAIAFKFIQAALTPAQIDQIVQLERTNR